METLKAEVQAVVWGQWPCTHHFSVVAAGMAAQPLPSHFVRQDWVARAAKSWEPTEGINTLIREKEVGIMGVSSCGPRRISYHRV